jgi:hypothetical protein
MDRGSSLVVGVNFLVKVQWVEGLMEEGHGRDSRECWIQCKKVFEYDEYRV